MVTTANISELRRLNFGFKSLTHGTDPDQILAQIRLHDAKALGTTGSIMKTLLR
ncbi:MAG: hypothetical protein OHK006_23220 [Thermodesulfovibrionales bacterium]